MIPADVQNSLKTLAHTQKTLITATAPVAANAKFEPGQKYEAQVQAQLAPGIFKVKIADHTLQLQLPPSIRSGDTITLQVISLLPRLTFNMAASANPLSTSDQLSETARLLSALTQQPLEKGFVRPTANTPLWTGSMQFPDSTELAGKLHEALSQSGLFYEAHQAQWIAGKRNTAQLMREAQNQPPDETARTLHEAFHHGETKPAQPNIAGIPDHLLSLVQQQLHALETRQVQWQGFVWQQQEMNWKIREEDTRSAEGGESRHWVTEIQLNLPQLGEVSAVLRFGAGGISLTLDASSEATRDKLGTASTQLVSTLNDRGISVLSARVNQHEPG